MNKNKGKEEEIRQKVKCDCRQCRRAARLRISWCIARYMTVGDQPALECVSIL
ncbi:hypothetical protein BJP29_22665 [Bacteroides fragilis]|nr:hypothetical protein BJP29_22665 [Bacteroides fragilis]